MGLCSILGLREGCLEWLGGRWEGVDRGQGKGNIEFKCISCLVIVWERCGFVEFECPNRV